MTSRLYRTTRGMYHAVETVLRRVHGDTFGTPTLRGLIALAVTGLLLLDVRQTQTRIAHVLPGRCHDALNRLLRLMPLSTRALMGLLVAFAIRLNRTGYLCVDDVIVEKAYAKRLRWAAWTYSFAQKRKVYGLHIVVVLWCSSDGQWRIPVAFRLWRPKRACNAQQYATKNALTLTMLRDLVAARLPIAYVVFDTQYSASGVTKCLTRLGLTWQGTLDPKTHVVWRGQNQSVRTVAAGLRLKWRDHLGLRATVLTVYAPKYGQLRLCVVKNRHGNFEYIVSNALHADLTTLCQRKRSRWHIETLFRDTKQYAGLTACQCWVDQAMVRHVALVLLTFVVCQMLRVTPLESVAAVKERWQMAVLRDGAVPPPPLRACPSELRATA